MSLSDLSNVVITTEGPALTQVGFGTILLAALHTHNTDMVREYESTSAMVLDGFTTTEPAYLMAAKVAAQNPRVKSWKIGRLTTGATQITKITPIALNSTIYSIKIIRGATSGTASFTSDATATIAEIVTGLVAAINALALAGVTAVDVGGTHLTITMAVGVYIYVSEWKTDRLKVEDITADYSIATQLAALRLADPNWYGLALEINSEAVLNAAASWAQSDGLVILCGQSSDWQVFDVAQTTDIASDLKLAAYTRTVLITSLTNNGDYRCAAMLGERFPSDPGAAGAGGTWHAKTLAGVAADALTATQKSGARGKNAMVYITTAGINHTLDGKTSSGEFADVTRFIDWFRVRTQERIAAAMFAVEKIPFTDAGVSVIVSAVRAQLQAGVIAGGFAASPEPVVTAPKVADVSAVDRGNRKLPNVNASAKLAGAIHLVDPITVTVSV